MFPSNFLGVEHLKTNQNNSNCVIMRKWDFSTLSYQVLDHFKKWTFDDFTKVLTSNLWIKSIGLAKFDSLRCVFFERGGGIKNLSPISFFRKFVEFEEIEN